MKISFNLRLGYNEACDCVDKIKELGGDGRIVVGGSHYTGTTQQIDSLLMYMGEKGYDIDSMAINEDPEEAKQRRVAKLKAEGIIE